MSAHRIQHHARLGSTNEHARQLVESGAAEAGLVVVADEQTAGRGQRGSTWHTVPGRSLAMSVVLAKPELPRPARITLLAAVAAARALEALGSSGVRIKWPNDLMRGERKIGGLLVEGVRTPSGKDCLVLGLGINLSLGPDDLPAEIARLAGDAGLSADRITRDALLARVLEELDRILDDLGTERAGEAGEEYRRRSWLRGREVRLAWNGHEESVRVRDVTGDGDLVLADGRTARGEHIRLLPDS
jgi:BirA family biotin operon repressor/biotin-[acetyl-CoA-carboxylase] ligase